jgi:hypothetical protein
MVQKENIAVTAIKDLFHQYKHNITRGRCLAMGLHATVFYHEPKEIRHKI